MDPDLGVLRQNMGLLLVSFLLQMCQYFHQFINMCEFVTQVDYKGKIVCSSCEKFVLVGQLSLLVASMRRSPNMYGDVTAAIRSNTTKTFDILRLNCICFQSLGWTLNKITSSIFINPDHSGCEVCNCNMPNRARTHRERMERQLVL